MSHARAVLVIRRASRLNHASRLELAAWLKEQALYLLRASDFMPTLTLRMFERDTPPSEADPDVGHRKLAEMTWQKRAHRKGSGSQVCSQCGEPGHNRRNCPN